MVRIICALSLLMIGFSHQPVTAAPALDKGAYELPDGTFSTLCTTSDTGSKQSPARSHACDACRLTNAVILSEPADLVGTIFPVCFGVVVKPQDETAGKRLWPPSHGPRAPPALPFLI